MLQPSEVVSLVIALFLLPIIVTSSRSIRHPQRVLILVAVGAMLAGYTFTIIEGFVLFDLFNTLEHAAYATAGVLTLVVMLRYRARVSVPRGES